MPGTAGGDARPTPRTILPRMSVAIIIPAYNAEAWLAEAIESALTQTHSASSVVVVDDGSTDNTAVVAEQFDDAVMLLRQANAGVSAARNHGAAQVKADWLLFLDADDRLREDALANLHSAIVGGNCGVAYGDTESFGETTTGRDKQKRCSGAPPIPALANFWKSVPDSPGAVLLRADVFHEAGGFDPALSTAADRALWLRLGMLANWAHTEAVVLERREHADSMVRNRGRARTQAAQAQLGFLEWCRSRGKGEERGFPGEDEIFTRNLLRAFDERLFDAAQWLAEEAARRGIANEAVTRARRYAGTPSFLRELEVGLRAMVRK